MADTLPFERVLWTGRPWRLGRRVAGDRYLLTDFRLIAISQRLVEEIALDDIADIQRAESRFDRLFGTSTIVVHNANGAVAVFLHAVRRGPQLAALLELLAGDPRAPRDPDAVRSALAWEPRAPAFDLRGALGGIVALIVATLAIVIGLHGRSPALTYTDDDVIAPRGQKRSEADIVRFMEAEVMPWARAALAPLKGGADQVQCATCHGAHGAERQWQMPAVARLPEPEVRVRGWETYTSTMDAQMRNAIYGYQAESENQAKAAYMREVIVPGMARLLHRPAYDFTRSYEYNRSRRALGCYHCHQVQ